MSSSVGLSKGDQNPPSIGSPSPAATAAAAAVGATAVSRDPNVPAMSPAVEDFLSQPPPSSSSTQRTYFQNPNPSVQKHPTDYYSGTFDNGFNLTNLTSKPDCCSNDAAAAPAPAATATATAVRSSSRRKHVKMKKLSSCSDVGSTKRVDRTGSSSGSSSTIGFVFNSSNSGSVLDSSLGQTSAGEFLDFNLLRFSMGATDSSKFGKKMDSEEADSRKVSEVGINEFGKVNGVDFVFGAKMNNGVRTSDSSKFGHGYGPEETVGRSGIDGFTKVNGNTAEADSHLVNSMFGLNLGTRGPGEVKSFMDDNPKGEEKNTSDARKSEKVDFVFSANHRDFVIDSNFQKEKSSFKGNGKINDEMDNLTSKGAGMRDYLKKVDDKIDSVPDSNAFGDNPISKVSDEMKTSSVHDPSNVNTSDKINDSVGDSCSCSNNRHTMGRSDTKSLNQCKAAKQAEAPLASGAGIATTSALQYHLKSLPDVAHLWTSLLIQLLIVLQLLPNPPTSQAKNEDAVDATEKLRAKNTSSSSSANVDAPVRQRPHLKKYKMKTGCGLEFTTSNSRVDASLAHESSSGTIQRLLIRKHVTNGEKGVIFTHLICVRGNQAYKNGELSEAEVCYSKGISSVQHTATPEFCIEPLLLCYSNRAATRMALGRMREGLKDCRMAAALDPKFVKANLRSGNGKALLELAATQGICHLLLGELDDALYNYNKCLESVDNVCLDRRIAIEAADGIQKAQLLTTKFSHRQKVADYLKSSAELLEQKTYESATNALRIIADALYISCYSEKLLQMKGEALLVLGKHEEVVQLCEQTLGLAEKNFATGDGADGYDCKNSLKLWRWNLMCKSYFQLGRLEMALELIEKHEQLRPTTDKIVGPEESLNSLAVTIRELLHCKNAGNEAFQSGKYAEAVEHYTAAISKSVESRSFAAVCFCNRAAAHQSLGGIADAIGDCSIAIALDGSYPKALSRRATLQEMIRDYKHAADDLQRLISILEMQSGKNSQKSGTPGTATGGSVKDLRRARRRLSSIEEKAKKERSLDLYLILGIKPSDAASEVKKAYRKAALRHHPTRSYFAGQTLARAESGSDGQQWKVIAESIQVDADRLFKMIGEAYAVLSDTTKRSKYDLEEEMWEEMNINVSSSSSRRASDFYNSPTRPPTVELHTNQERPTATPPTITIGRIPEELTIAPIRVGKSFTKHPHNFLHCFTENRIMEFQVELV
ncbi:hypothetical protein OSB04_020681 [Centaurea solstitialis]|uniref:J domain-containing protein n=1 Tax=Centaurea solstitialis TaxID=347529 RepID=A0AA38TCC0_9ASTR|nr:hypothetical protein OSB04_020681 [Centaurea solstitialis]